MLNKKYGISHTQKLLLTSPSPKCYKKKNSPEKIKSSVVEDLHTGDLHLHKQVSSRHTVAGLTTFQVISRIKEPKFVGEIRV